MNPADWHRPGATGGATVSVGEITIGGRRPLVLIAGPCVVEGRELLLRTAAEVRRIAAKHNTPAIFKSSYKKANRTSGKTFAGLGMDEALTLLAEAGKETGMPLLTDIHAADEAAAAAEVADVLQIPAFLCRQTELLRAAGETGRAVNIKKGQFLAAEDLRHAAEKVRETGNERILLTERGTTFGYHDLVVDMRNLRIMAGLGWPVVLDATHSVQRPGGGAQTAGSPEFIFPLARAGAAVGLDALFVEVHPDPPAALSDAGSQLPLEMLGPLLQQLTAIDRLVKQF